MNGPEYLSDEEVDNLERLTRDPANWPEHARQSLPVIRDLIVRWQANRAIAPGQMSAEDIGRRIGAIQ